MSMNKLAKELHVPANRITQIIEGRRSITANDRKSAGRR
jgi:plasmid maintenance system antidote protein VapI